jgi:hypothetical protein
MNKKFLFLIFSLSVLFASCEKDSSTSYSTSQTAPFRPAVAIAPVIDHSESGLGWDLSDEITYSVSTRLIQKSKLNVTDPQKTRTQIRKNKAISNPFGSDLSWVKKTFPTDDFVVFMELIEHREQLRESGNTNKTPEALSADLNLALRLRIVDVRKEQPRIVLQEIIQDSHFIPRQFTRYNFDQAPWNSEEFSITPIGIAHSLLIKQLSSRIDDYISLSKSNS